jgi:hypothetical protein
MDKVDENWNVVKKERIGEWKKYVENVISLFEEVSNYLTIKKGWFVLYGFGPIKLVDHTWV